MSKVMNVEGELEIHIKGGAVITITEFEHMGRVWIDKDDVKVEIILNVERSNNVFEVKMIAPLRGGRKY